MSNKIFHNKDYKKGIVQKIFVDKKTLSLTFTIIKSYPKLQRYLKVEKKVLAHIPKEFENKIKVGQLVEYATCRKLSTLKSKIITSIVK